ncbi:MAG: hypothetical protein J07HQX50_02317 [Haloquadratum sp. J07HQX50]|nr:MAG: hypothetical protein J07HQX50_02317 [Haloquadratum sp. J07HQX50]
MGVIETKSVGTTLSGVEAQSQKYIGGFPEGYEYAEDPLPFAYESTGTQTYARDALAADYEILIEERGVVINRIDVRKNQAQQMIEWVNDAFEETPVWEVRERASIQRALTNGHSIFREESCDQADVFTQIAASLNTQFGFAEVETNS